MNKTCAEIGHNPAKKDIWLTLDTCIPKGNCVNCGEKTYTCYACKDSGLDEGDGDGHLYYCDCQKGQEMEENGGINALRCPVCKHGFSEEGFAVSEPDVPMVHKECMEPDDFRNAIRRKASLIRFPLNKAARILVLERYL